MRPWHAVLVGTLLGGTVGCATTKSEHLGRTFQAIYASPTVVDHPPVGQVKTAEVGESLVSKEKLLSVTAMDLEQPIEHPIENMGRKATLTLLPGRYVLRGSDPHGKYFQALDGKFLENGKPVKYVAGIYVPDGDALATEVYVIGTTGLPLTYRRPNIPLAKSVHQTRDELSFKRELVYTGVSGNVVSVLYREFSNDFARPAFSQELRYDLSDGRVVGYRGARFEIVKATNQGITYKIFKQLE